MRHSGSAPLASAVVLYAIVALLLTWPLLPGLARDVPSDLGDSVLNLFVLGRNVEYFERALAGGPSALAGFWDARIFHPAPLTLAYSEHLLAQSAELLPVSLLGGGLLLGYNLLFLSTFVLSALGTFLLVRELTGRWLPALLGGLFYGFAMVRVDQLSHLQILSSQWMPFALLGLRRYVVAGRPAALAGAAAATVAQNLSCGYYLLFFPPFALAYVLFEMHRCGCLASARRWAGLLAGAAVTAAATLPFLLPYRELRQAGAILRPRWEVEHFSADIYSYLTAPDLSRLWGGVVSAYSISEAQLFPGLVAPLLAACAVVLATRAAWRRLIVPPATGLRRLATIVLLVLALSQVLASAALLAGLGGPLSSLVYGVKIRSLPHALELLGLALGGLLVVSPRARALLREASRSPVAFFAAAMLAAAWLSLGPVIRTRGQDLGELGLYGLLYQYVPGFDGLRVPGRYGMLVALFGSVLAGLGVARLEREQRWRPWLPALGLLFLIEVNPAPLVLNDVWAEPGLNPPAGRLLLGRETPPIYAAAAQLPASAVLIEFPFGSDPYELRYMLRSLAHGRRLVNGFSGAQPETYRRLRPVLRDVLRQPDAAWQAVRESGATHAIVHESAWRLSAKGRRVSAWLEQNGARVLAREGDDVLFALPVPRDGVRPG